MNVLRKFTDCILGRGDAAVTVPNLDGPLLPNQELEEAKKFADLPAADNLVPTKQGLIASSDHKVLLYPWSGDKPSLIHEFNGPVSAIACANGTFAFAIDGFGVII